MPTDSQLEECYNNFLENHILVRDDWLKDALDYILREFRSYSGRRLYNSVFEQWLYSDLADTTYSTLETVDAKARRCEVHQPLILQITSLVDIGSSLLSQFNKLTYEFVDNTGFDIDPSEQKEDDLYRAKPSRCLLLTLSDGEREMRAMERRAIPSLSLLTAPGCKVVLYPPLISRKGVFLLNQSNIQVLGGDDERMMEIGRPLEVMARKLGRELPKRRDFTHLNTEMPIEMTEDEERDIREFEEMEDQFDPADFEPVPSTVVRPAATVPPTRPAPPTVTSTTPIVTNTPATIRPSPSTVPPSTVSSPLSATLSPPTPRPPQRSITVEGTDQLIFSPQIPDNTQSTNSSMQSLHISTPSTSFDNRSMKREVETIDLDDDEGPSTSTGITRSSPVAKKEEKKEEEEGNRFVSEYRSLKLITIEEAVRQAKYQTGGSRRRSEAFVDSFVEALRVVDGLWTMKIMLKDESHSGLECVIHSSVLEKLIGLSVEEAMTIRSSTDVARKQEGAKRLAATEDILSRLDLIWTIEFFPSRSKVTPIVRDVQTLAEILNAFD